MQPQSPSPAQDLQISREAFARGDFAHAAEHASSALAANPQWAEALELLDSIIDAAVDKESLLKPGQTTYFAHGAGRARVLYRIGRVGEGVETLLSVLKVAPERGYERWAVGWLASSGVTIRPATAYGFLSSVIQDTLTRARLRPSEREYLARFVPLVSALLATPSCADDGVIRIGASGIYRRVGRVVDALEVLRFAAPPRIEVLRLSMLGLALRAKGDYSGAESAFRAAYQSDHDTAQLIEVVRARWDAGDLKGAMDVLESTYPHLTDPDEEVRLMLEYLRSKVRGGQPESPLLSILGKDATPDDLVLVQMFEVGLLEAPPEATINVIQQAIAKRMTLDAGDFRLRVSTIEAPSVRLAASLVLTGSPDPGLVNYEFESMPQPDPRMPVRHVAYLAWRYDGGVPRQGCPLPQTELRSTVEALAREPYFLPRWWRRAAQVAESIGPGSATGLVAAMVYPSAPPSSFTAWDWIRRVQFASALTLAQLDRDWRTGQGRQALLDVIDGPMDWVVDAAVVALVERALDDPTAITEVASSLEKLRLRIPDPGSWSIRGSLPFAYLRLPGRPAAEREAFKEVARNYFVAHRAR